MRKPSPQKLQIDALLPSIRKLLATCPQFTVTPTSGPMRGIDYSQGRLTINYLAYAERIDGRLRASAPHFLGVRFDGEIVLKIRWDDGRRNMIVYKPGRWENTLEIFARR